MIKAVIFDYGDVIIYVPEKIIVEGIANSYQMPLEEFMKVVPPLFHKFDKGLPEKKFWVLLSKKLGKPIPKNCFSLFVDPFLKHLVFYPEVLSLVKRLRKKGIKTAVLSNNCHPQEKVIRDLHGFDDFDLVILSNRVGLRKPDPKIYKLTVEKLGVKPSECIYVEDKETYLTPAQKLGMRTILAVSPRQTVKEVSRLVSLPHFSAKKGKLGT